MTAQLIDGRAVAAAVLDRVLQATLQRTERGLRAPALATVLVGNDPASEVYVRNKRLACDKVGIRSIPVHFDADVTQEKLLTRVDMLNADPLIDGVLVQLPLPRHIDATRVIERIRADKDVDGFHPYNLGRLAQRMPTLRPCTPLGVIELLKSVGEPFKRRHAVVVGASNHVGRPMALELLLTGATTTVCHRFTYDLAEEVSRADIVVVAVGRPGLIHGDWIKAGATVIDVGMNRLADGRLVGDCEFERARERAAFITPVPGGVGTMTVAMLMQNTLQAAETADTPIS
ncbi:bifunctional methylenetetrahydrofolate dehydrogenase/methenyltetrahydrofolate cyclohydrolase FolD [Sinimarinibacterium sp. CAU 1509]|uniref:bifunctional methylenetetrahydrofolate dehydrogenase/methenyltetrahydrofolate cyclohydrolase FolD n=1 Tax=Sinimarinibacterium sp. CAU 1509 TaxID=2562283 RepID=UPI0010ABAC4C|nr:bifunctional methylenetetrahydrofolate dehydrogenase/methenyltetrahydrofolate cyclohydrolase FolD [Sinimarinibacterium sp. CAU 1509]TJY60856.1 bifunctional methylenetetrahydrofolate dehydrogenase/methenyltetrahydrofolate cyclohydrolase FolD [Sinimarinibacterium sp. CAU 1509]